MTEQEQNLLNAAREILSDFNYYGETLQVGDNGEYGTKSSIGMLSAAVHQYSESTPPDPQHGREPDKVKPKEAEWVCSRCGNRNAADNEVCMGAEMGDGRCGKPKPKEPKLLAQYLDEYIEHEVELDNIESADMYAYNSWRELLEQALDAYQSTENVTIKIERV